MKQVKHKSSGSVHEVIAETDEFYWIARGDGRPVTSPKKYWEEYTPEPETGDVWEVPGVANYRCLGVDKERGVAHWVSARSFHKGNYPVDFYVQAHPVPEVNVYTRALPETTLKFKERP